MERHLVGSLNRIHTLWALSLSRDNRCNTESNDVAELDNDQDHVVIVISKNGQFAFTTIHGTGRASAKQLRHVLTCLMWIHILRMLSLIFSHRDSSTILH